MGGLLVEELYQNVEQPPSAAWIARHNRGRLCHRTVAARAAPIVFGGHRDGGPFARNINGFPWLPLTAPTRAVPPPGSVLKSSTACRRRTWTPKKACSAACCWTRTCATTWPCWFGPTIFTPTPIRNSTPICWRCTTRACGSTPPCSWNGSAAAATWRPSAAPPIWPKWSIRSPTPPTPSTMPRSSATRPRCGP